jgi:hypothetical protein
MALSFGHFIAKWTASGAAERANKDAFLLDLCEALNVPRPDPTTGDADKDAYVFEKDALIPHEGGSLTVGKIDLFKSGCFILEAKQGSDATSKKLGSAKRGTPAWNVAMSGAYGQALGYARSFDRAVPFLVTCDIGHCFDLYAAFDGSWNYRPFPNAQSNRIFLPDLEKHADMLRRVFLDPLNLDPSRQSAKVTREVATHLAELAKALEAAKHPPESVATFLMRCIFTMFAEDVGLLPDRLFTDAVEKLWIESPASFPGGIESLWRAMNQGTDFGFVGKLLKFNGGLFAQPSALPLTRDHLKLLLEAAKCNWADVEPAIFGTLLERALDPKERHALGAHYTPRAYVERLVRPTIEEPLRADWEIVQAEVRQLVAADKVEAAKKAVRAFHQKLCSTKVLDPACGSGNFLYVTLDLFKRLEGEVLALLDGLGDTQQLVAVDTIRVTPAQFLGIEIKRWAKEIAELVLWIGYLQHHYRGHGKASPPPEPVLQDYRNIECRDAVLAYDEKVLATGEDGKPLTRWDGETYKKSGTTGEEVPDTTAVAPVYAYVNPRKAAWPEAEFIIGNPPFVGNKRMRATFGDGYVNALRSSWDDVPDGSDFVMYWWKHGAERVRSGGCRASGFITTNSISQSMNRRVTSESLAAPSAISLVFAIPDHPWTDTATGAAVRIAMTVCVLGKRAGRVSRVVAEDPSQDDTVPVELIESRGFIHPDLTVGPDVLSAVSLRANDRLSFQGPILVGEGFRLDVEELAKAGYSPDALPPVVHAYVIGRDIVQKRIERYVIDFFGLSQEAAFRDYPSLMQRIVDTVKPHRVENKDRGFRDRWWIWGRPRPDMRHAIDRLPRFIATVETSKFKPFVFLPSGTTPDHKLYVVASDDAYVLGILSSRVHGTWALAAGGRLGVGNDPTWTNGTCFLPFAFPRVDEARVSRVRSFAESLDTHRKRQQSQHPDLTITGMYNVLEKLRSGDALSAKEKVIHEQGLVSVLKQIHDDLDAAVFDAYGWPHDLSDEQILERLVALNAERAEEERNGLVRWLRPEFQNPGGKQAATQADLAGVEEDEAAPVAAAVAPPWPKKMPEQVAAVRDLLVRGAAAWSVAQVVAAFKGAKAKDVEPVLDSLAAVGLFLAYDGAEGRRWRVARVAA